MKRVIFHLLSLILLIISHNLQAHTFSAVNSEGDTIYYATVSSSDRTVSVSYRGSLYSSYNNEYRGDIKIPSTVVNYGITYTVVNIGGFAFRDCTELTSVTLPNTITKIFGSAFYNCLNLNTVNIGNSLNEISMTAFAMCSNLASIKIHAYYPPTVDDDSFFGVPTNLQIIVPCISLSSYQTAAYWSNFTNIIASEHCISVYDTNVTAISATLNATITDTNYTSKGFLLKVSGATTFNTYNDTSSSFQRTFNNLIPNTKYQYQAYYTVDNETYYTQIDSFKTEQCVFTYYSNVTTTTVSLNASSSVANLTRKGFQWRALGTSFSSCIDSTSAFQYNLTNLIPNTLYEYRAYVVINNATYYTAFDTLKTQQCLFPSYTNITPTTATLLATTTEANYTSKGFQYRLLGATTFNTCIDTSSSFQYHLTNLLPFTKYEYRAYININNGRCYSDIDTFKTSCLSGIISMPLIEDFEDTLDCWEAFSSNTNSLSIASTGVNPTCYPHSGVNMLMYNSYNINAGNYAGYITPKINILRNSQISLWIYRNNGSFSNANEGLRIFINSAQSLDGSTELGFISNSRTADPVINADGWYNYIVSIPYSEVGEKYIILKAESKYGYNIYFDDLNITLSDPEIETLPVTDRSPNSATLNGRFLYGLGQFISKGFEYKRSIDTIWNVQSMLIDTAEINYLLTGLIPNTDYNVRAYAVTAIDTLYGLVENFTTLLPRNSLFEVSICQGEVYTLNGFNIDTSGTYIRNLTTISGEDSTITLNIIVNPVYTTNITANIRAGETYNLNGFNAFQEGLYTQNLQTIHGCDSIVNLTLTLIQPMTIINGDTIYYNITSRIAPYTVEVTFRGETFNQYTNEYRDTINIPSIITYHDTIFSVTSIGYGAFKNCSSLLQVNMPSSVILIDDYAFQNCSGLNYIDISPSVKTIGYWAFSGCTKLSYITIKDSITNINYNAFNACTSLKTVNFNAINCARMEHYNSVVFTSCDSLQTVNFGNNVINIPEYAFSGCNKLSTVNFSNSIKSIGAYAFNDCSSITTLNIPNTINSIGKYAFQNCNRLAYLNIPDSVRIISDGTFQECRGLTNFTVPINIDSIGNYAFSNCINLISISVPSTITYIGNYAFNNCIDLTSFVIPTSLTAINSSCFYYCTSLTSIIIPSSVKSIGNKAFSSCSGLNSVIIGDSVITISQEAFAGCNSISTLNLPNSLTSIGSLAFSYCSSLTSIIIPSTVNYIGNGGFFNCSNLMSFTIPTSLSTISASCFSYCTSLTNITIPSSITSIGENGFAYCNGLTSISCLATVPPTTVNGTFYNIPNIIPIYVPCSSVSLYQAANNWRNFINIQANTIPVYTDISSTICQGETYTLNGFNADSAGVYTNNILTINGCDSILRLTLSIVPSYDTIIYATICQGQIYSENGFNAIEEGMYVQNLQKTNGCDSIINLILSVNPSFDTNIIASVCFGNTYSDNGFNADSAGVYTQYLQTINGCDSIVNLTLTTIQNSIPSNLIVDVMPNYINATWQGNGEYYELYRNSELIATVTQPQYLDSNVVNFQAYCYKVKSFRQNCESEFSLISCRSFAILEDQELNEVKITLYPNPTNDKSTLEIEGLTKEADVIVYDINGRKVKQYNLNSGQKKLEIDVNGLAKGVYYVKIVNYNISLTRKLIVK